MNVRSQNRGAHYSREMIDPRSGIADARCGSGFADKVQSAVHIAPRLQLGGRASARH
uniref:Uncharacterized protein n=1 Tax=Anguilla anguilla TaxID=7936 RepID=A0A0E9QLC5_ANGAN